MMTHDELIASVRYLLLEHGEPAVRSIGDAVLAELARLTVIVEAAHNGDSPGRPKV